MAVQRPLGAVAADVAALVVDVAIPAGEVGGNQERLDLGQGDREVVDEWA
ncbi:MAG: hypothetical protein M3387_13120 [Actinomycetota bacterium]|nr:hypothetical protein [Actinomycetota bacterium]